MALAVWRNRPVAENERSSTLSSVSITHSLGTPGTNQGNDTGNDSHEGSGVMWGEEGVGGVSREEALAAARRSSGRRSRGLRIETSYQDEGAPANVPGANASENSQAPPNDRGHSKIERALVIVVYITLISFFLLIIVGNPSGTLHSVSVLIVAGALALWLVVLAYRCIRIRVFGEEAQNPANSRFRTPVNLQDFLAMNAVATPPRTVVDPKVRQSFRYFKFSDSGGVTAAIAAAAAASETVDLEAGIAPVDSTASAAAAAEAATAKRTAAAAAAGSAAAAGTAAGTTALGTAAVPAGSGGGSLQRCSSWTADETCTICLDDYREGHELCRLPCQHIFHARCVDTWLSNHAECPLCKHSLAAPPDAAEASRAAAQRAAPRELSPAPSVAHADALTVPHRPARWAGAAPAIGTTTVEAQPGEPQLAPAHGVFFPTAAASQAAARAAAAQAAVAAAEEV
ncbi:unnamed protein product [Phaeothamnion confervicola]